SRRSRSRPGSTRSTNRRPKRGAGRSTPEAGARRPAAREETSRRSGARGASCCSSTRTASFETRPRRRFQLELDVAGPRSQSRPCTGYIYVTTALSLSALEVAALADLDEGKIRKDVEHGIFDKPRFSIGDLVYFRLLALLGLQVSVDDRRRI